MERLHIQQDDYSGPFKHFEGFLHTRDRDNTVKIEKILADLEIPFHWHFITHRFVEYPDSAQFCVFGISDFGLKPNGWACRDGWCFSYDQFTKLNNKRAESVRVTRYKLSLNGNDLDWDTLTSPNAPKHIAKAILKHSEMSEEAKTVFALVNASMLNESH